MERFYVVYIAAVVVLSLCCLVVLWGWAFDSSGLSTLITLAGAMFSLSLMATLPGRAALIVQRIGAMIKLRSAAAATLASAGGRREARVMIRLLAASAVFAACGVLGSIGGILLASAIAERLSKLFIFSPAGWIVVKFILQFVGMLPFAMGTSVAFLVASIVRGGSGRDYYAPAVRDWLWGSAVGLAIFALAWTVGASMFGIVVIACCALLGAAVVISQRRKWPLRRRLIRPVEAVAQRWRRVAIIAVFGGAILAMLAQLRMLGDIAGFGLAGGVCWVVFSVVVLAGFLRRVDRKSRPPGRPQGLGATVGILTVVMGQSALGLMCVVGTREAVVCATLAAALQIPLLALMAVVVSRTRRVFAAGGGRARAYLSSAAAGAGLGVVAYISVGSLPGGSAVALTVALAGCAMCVIVGLSRARRPMDQLKWAVCGVVLMCSLTAAELVAIGSAARAVGTVTPGVWLTIPLTSDESGNPDGGEAKSVPPALRPPWRSEVITTLQQEVMVAHKGFWWLSAGSPADLLEEIPIGIEVVFSLPDPTAMRPGSWGPLRSTGGGALQLAQRSLEKFDGGILLEMLPSDHRCAWRCYNERSVRRFAAHLLDGGVMMIRTQARANRLAAAIAVAKTFHRAIGPGWAMIDMNGGDVDILLVGPAERVDPTAFAGTAAIVSTERISEDWPDIRPIRIDRPAMPRRRILGPGRFYCWVQQVAVRPEADK